MDNFRGGEREEGDADGAFVNQSGDNFRGGEREEGDADGAFVNQSGDICHHVLILFIRNNRK